ncbi:MAG: hypothetical protein HOV80_15295 [Polyangiaceae bacterium]|nr:hypothetical protein [Polyangiaceae bacterium]
MVKKIAAAAALLLAGCSVIYDLGEYDEGTGSGATTGTNAGPGTTGASMTGSGSTTTGAGGMLDCGSSPVPPASEVIEDFNAGYGALVVSGGCVSNQAGEAVFEPGPPVDYCWLDYPGPRRLACASFSVRVNEVTTSTLGAQTFFYMDDLDSGVRMHLLLEGSGFQLTLADGSMDVPFIDDNHSYNPFTDVYWRIRGDDQNNVAFDTSEDGMIWNNRAFGPSPIGLESVQIAIGAGSHLGLGGADAGRARVDCLNIAPCN